MATAREIGTVQIVPNLSVLRAQGSTLSTPAPTRLGSCSAQRGSPREHLAEVHAAAAAEALAAAPRSEVQPAGAAHPRSGPAAVAAPQPLEASARATCVSRPRVDILV